jgi:hypothetical protein
MGLLGASISQDARFVAWGVWHMVSPYDVFVYDRLTGITELINITADGLPVNGNSFQPSVSAGGLYVAFGSDASNLVADDTNSLPDIFVRDRRALVFHPPWRHFLPLVVR